MRVAQRFCYLGLLAGAFFICSIARPALATVSILVDMTATPNPVGPGAVLAYDIVVTNNGDEPALNVTLASTVPAGTSFFDASDGGTVGEGNLVSWSVGSLAGFGTQKTVTLSVEIDFPRPPDESIVNAVVAMADNGGSVSDGTLTSVQPLGVDATVETSPSGCPGSPFRTYKIRFSNGSVDPITNLGLTGEIPPGTAFDSSNFAGTPQCSTSATACNRTTECPGGESCQVTWNIGTLNSNEQSLRIFAVRVDDVEAAGTSFDSAAVLTNGSTTATDNAPTTVIADLPCPVLSKVDLGGLTVEPGGVIQYSIIATNVGRTAATNVIVSDPVPASTSFGTADPVPCGASGPAGNLGIDDIVRWALGTLDPTEQVSMCLEVDVDGNNPAPSILNIASLDDDEGDSVQASASTSVEVATALKLTKDAEPTPVNLGEAVEFQITFQNVADFAVSGVEITDDLNADFTPAGCASFAPAETAACGGDVPATEAGGVVTWNVGSVVPGDTVAVCFVMIVSGDEACRGQTLRNVARVIDDRGEETSATGTTRVPGTAAAVSALRLLKTAPGQAKVQAGADLIYTFELTNRLAVSLTNVTITDDLSQVTPAGGVVFLNANSSECGGTGPDGSEAGGIVTWTFPNLAPGPQTVCLRVRTNSQLPNGELIRNRAQALAPVVPPNTDGASEDEITTRVFVNRLRVRILDLDDPVQPGSDIRFEISVENLGDDPLDDVRVRTRVPAGTTLVCVSGSTTIDCAPPAQGVTIDRDPSLRGRRAVWLVDGPLGTLIGENTRTMRMVVTVTSKRRTIRGKAKAREFTFRSRSKSRSLTVVERPE